MSIRTFLDIAFLLGWVCIEDMTARFFLLIGFILCWTYFVYYRADPPPIHQGGLSAVPPQVVSNYFQSAATIKDNFQWNPSVQQLARVINSDPTLRFNWEYGISQSENLACYTGEEVLGMLNVILNVGPAFDTSGLVGFPINVLFVHLMQNQSGRSLFGNVRVNEALKEVLNDYGTMLSSPRSLTYMNGQNQKGWFSAEAQKHIDYSLYECNPSLPHFGFNNWNEWFLRKFRTGKRERGAGAPAGARPRNIIINSCESTPIANPQQPTRNVQASSPFWLKDCRYSLTDMFGNYGREKSYGSLFVGGTVLQSFLSAISYHHWHAPVSGKIVDVYTIPGTYFLDQSQFTDTFDPYSPDLSQSFISHTAARMVFIIKADNPKLGYIGLVYVGMAECSGVENSKGMGDRVEQGDHIGNFLFGGSSYVILFQKHAKLAFTDRLYSPGSHEKQGQEVLSFLARLRK